MKKLMFLLPLAALTIASCSNDEGLTTQQKEIEKEAVVIRPLVQSNTRGEAITLANLSGFKVFAADADETKPALDGGAFTDLVTSSGDGSTWSTGGVHYWKSNDTESGEVYENNTAKFLGVYPSDQFTETSYPETHALDFSTIVDGRDLEDIMVAYSTGSPKGNGASGVALNFKHVLSQIVIQAANKNTDERKIEIVGVKLANVKQKGTLTFPTTATTPTLAGFNPISNVTTPTDIIIKRTSSESPVELTATAQNIMFDGGTGGFMVLPQALSSNDTPATTDNYISVLCRIYKKDGENWVLSYPHLANGETDSGSYAFTSVGISGNWEVGKKYTYTLNFFQGSGGAGTVDPKPTDPNPQPGDDPVDPTPDPTDTGKVDEGPTKVPIYFTVTVDDWQDASGDFNKAL